MESVANRTVVNVGAVGEKMATGVSTRAASGWLSNWWWFPFVLEQPPIQR